MPRIEATRCDLGTWSICSAPTIPIIWFLLRNGMPYIENEEVWYAKNETAAAHKIYDLETGEQGESTSFPASNGEPKVVTLKQKIRKWAASEGIELSAKGRIPKKVEEAYAEHLKKCS